MAESNLVKLKLKVNEGLVEDSRKGIVRINRKDVDRLGVNIGDTRRYALICTPTCSYFPLSI